MTMMTNKKLGYSSMQLFDNMVYIDDPNWYMLRSVVVMHRA